MNNQIWGLILVLWLLALATILVIALLSTVKRLADTNKQILILMAGKETKPEATLRALVASDRPPRKPLPGIATEKKDDKPKNTDYTLQIG